MLEGQVDEAFEHAIELGRLSSDPTHALMSELADQSVQLAYIDLVAGEPELHFDLVLGQLIQGRWRTVRRQAHGLHQQRLQP
ncbi:hypothetical protein D9M71_676630 [compost metagenome]